jgi:hypothetical protein
MNDDYNVMYDYFHNLYVKSIIDNYYLNIYNYLNSPNYNVINSFFNDLTNDNSQLIYNTNINLDYLLLQYLFLYIDSTIFNNSFSTFDITSQSYTNNFYFNNLDTNNYLKFIFLPASPYYRIYYLYNFLTTMSTDIKLINQMPNDLIQLRDLLLQLLINLLYFSPNQHFDSNPLPNYNFSNFDTNIFFTFNVFVSNVFLAFDDINIFYNEMVKNIFADNDILKQIYIYCPFYFYKNNVNLVNNSTQNPTNTVFNNIFSENGFDILTLLRNIYDNVKFNFDSIVINALLFTILHNTKYFINVQNIINFVNTFFLKVDFNFTNCIDTLNVILNSSIQYNNTNLYYDSTIFITNVYYSNCYLTSYSIGVLFDNMDKLIIDTINTMASLTNKLVSNDMYSHFYKTISFDIKQYKNILLFDEIIDGFTYYKKILFNVDISIGSNALQSLQNTINGITKYLFDNFIYLLNYLVSDYMFKDLLLTIDNYLQIYNTKNNTNINLYNYFYDQFKINVNTLSSDGFQTNNIIVIYILFFLFIVVCLTGDVINFIKSNINETFDSYVNSLYSQNIYLNCLESFIAILNNNDSVLIFNYSNIYIQNIVNGTNLYGLNDLNNYFSYIQPSLYSIIYNPLISINNINYYQNKLLDYAVLYTNYPVLTNRMYINQYNINDIVSWFQLNINYTSNTSITFLAIKQLSFNVGFNTRYRNNINMILNENEKLLFTINNKHLTNFISNNKLVSTDLFSSFEIYVNTIYQETITIISYLYNNLITSYQSLGINYYTNYQQMIINQLFNIINKFHKTTLSNSNTYSYNLLFSTTCKLPTSITQIVNVVDSNNLYQITKYEPTIPDFTNIRDFLIRYLNSRITSSINIERNVNRFIYNYINQYILKTNKYAPFLMNYMNSSTLYDYVKLYNKIYVNSENIKYQTNLALYQNDIVFEILNYLNYTDKTSFMQNPIFNDFIINFSLVSLDVNSFYNNFKRFVHFLQIYNNEHLFNKFILSNGVNVIMYFLDLFNLGEFHELIYKFINLTEGFSPITIYDSVVNLDFKSYDIPNIQSKFIVDFDHIMKKIVIYLFILYLINANLFNIINDTIRSKILADYYLEYTFPNADIIVNLNTVFDDNFYLTLEKYIYYITVFDPDYPSVYKIDIETINEFTEPTFFYDIRNNTNAKDFLNLCYKYITSFELTIGFNNINTNSLLSFDSPTDVTISNCIKNYNQMLNIDQSINNPNSYFMTNAIIIILDVKYNIDITDINNNTNNTNIISQFALNNMKYYTHTQISNTNLLLILVVYLLNKYNITYSDQLDNISNIIAKFRIGVCNISEIFEELKGYSSDNYIKNSTINFTQTKNLNNSSFDLNLPTIFSRSQNQTDLSVLVSNTNNYSNIMPIDYDFDTCNFNFKQIYNKGIDIYKKYYSYNFNFYKFENNYVSIYQTKYTYFTNIIENDYALLNIKTFNNELFNEIFTNIIYTWLSQPYFIYNGDNSLFVPYFNQIIKLYMKYYWTFKSSNLLNIETLKTQKILKIKASSTMTLSEINIFLQELYFYELYSSPYTSIKNGSVTDNFNYFIQQLELQGNYNFEYVNYVYNFAFNLTNCIIIINWFLLKNFKITNNNFVFTQTLINYFIDEISSFSNISEYFKNSYLYNPSNSNIFIYSNVVNTINYNDFIERFSKVIKHIIFYTENISFDVCIVNLYKLYFQDVVFYYKTWIENSSDLATFVITLKQMQQYVYSYLNYILTNNNDSIVYSIFKKIINNTLINVNTTVLCNLYKWIFADEYIYEMNTINEYLAKELYSVLKLNFLGMVYSDYLNYYNNKTLNFKILVINYGTMIINNPNLTIDYIINTNYKLMVLYKLIIFSIMITNISDFVFKNLFLYVLTNCSTYVYFDNMFYCVDLENDICNYLDFANNNIIPNNLISNYYKSIQNNTIKQINNYKINSFYNYNMNMDFMSNIYNSITTTLLKRDETSIISVFITNSVVNILNQYNDVDINNWIPNDKTNMQYINKIYDTILIKISAFLDIIKQIFGGTNKVMAGIPVSTSQLINICSNEKLKKDNNPITIFTLIYDNFNNLGIDKINYNMLIILFYYICMIIYILNKLDVKNSQYFFNNSNTFILKLINECNIQIYNYVNGLDKLSTNAFFDELNQLLFYTNSNEIFTEKILNFFDRILNIQQILNEKMILQVLNVAKLKTYSGEKITINNDFINNMLYKKYVKNNKILVWNNMLVNIVDANLSLPMFNMKSLMYDTLFDIPALFLKTIIEKTDGLFSNYGMINLLENLQLYIGDELIDKITKEQLIIIKNLMTNVNVLNTLNQMLGIDDSSDFIKSGMIKPYILQVHKNHSLYLPLYFFFKTTMCSLPLISCMYSDVIIKVLNSPNNLIKNFYNIHPLLLVKKQINTSMLFNYILLEREERKKLTLEKQDNFIEKHNFYSVSNTVHFEIDNSDNLLFVNFDFNIGGLIKEIFWTWNFYLNGYLIENTQCINDLLLSTVFYINGIKRDGILPIYERNYSNITKILNPYRYNTRTDINNDINVYSFSFSPEKIQPTGTINMDMYNTFRIQLVFNKNKFIKYFGYFNYITNLDTLIITMKLSTSEYNFLRCQSGLAGLLFMK